MSFLNEHISHGAMVGSYGTSEPQIVGDDSQAGASQQSEFAIKRCAAGPRKRIQPDFDEDSSPEALPSLSPSRSPPPNPLSKGNHTPQPLNQNPSNSTTRPLGKRPKKSAHSSSYKDEEWADTAAEFWKSRMDPPCDDLWSLRGMVPHIKNLSKSNRIKFCKETHQLLLPYYKKTGSSDKCG